MLNNKLRRNIIVISGVLLMLQLRAASGLPNHHDLVNGFIRPPDSAKPWVYWWWLDSYATKEGITKDLEEMKRQGIVGVLLFDAGKGKGSPVGPVFMSPKWRELFKHSVREANRLGIEMGINLCSGWNAGGTWVTPKHAAKKLVYSELCVKGPVDFCSILDQPSVVGGYYRDIAVLAYQVRNTTDNANENRPGIKNWEVKSANRGLKRQPLGVQYDEHPSVAGEQDCDSNAVLDLSESMDESGCLSWKVPQGEWKIICFGYTLLGAKTKCASPGAQGYQIDFFSAEAMDMHFAQTGEKLLSDVGDLVGKTLKYFHVDSYEAGRPTWTPKFRSEFQARRGYDLLVYLPVLAGKIVDSREVSNRFLWDYRRTIGDLFAEKYYGRLRELSQRHGVGTHPESGGPFWPHIDALQCLCTNTIPMGEFWKRSGEPDGPIIWERDYGLCDTVKQAASAAHIYGKRLCQAEAFTSVGQNWEECPFMLKDIGDRAFCAGLTRNVLCFYVHQGRLDIKPGYQWDEFGTYFNRNITWWDQIHAWLTYLSRCQFMLQQGLFVGDVCYFYGEDVPNFVPAKTHMQPPLPQGYDCDTVNVDVLMNRMSVKDSRLVLADGMSYKLLILPERPTMSPRVLHKIKKLVEDGAMVVGPKPTRSPGLTDYPNCDVKLKRLADELWGRVDGQSVKERQIGKGKIIWGKSLQEILLADGVLPDFEYRHTLKDTNLDYIHRRHGEVEIYFVSNQENRPEKAECLFRVSGKQPEIWDPVTGERWEAKNYSGFEDRTLVPLEFAPRQSWFIVFRKLISYSQAIQHQLDDKLSNFPILSVVGELNGPWTVKFDPRWGGPESIVFEKLVDWTKRPEKGIKYYSGRATYQKTFDLPDSLLKSGKRLHLNLGTVNNVAEVRLNGKYLGVVWTAPWQVEITGAGLVKGNKLEIDVVNLWPNRLIGDANLPSDKRLTVTNVKKFDNKFPLLKSGLLGPVTLQAAQ